MTGASLRDRASRAAHGAAARLRHPATIACAYAGIAIFTFGHAATEAYRVQHSPMCATVEARSKSVGMGCYGDPAAGALLAGLLWPLWWSWELQQ